MALLKRTLWRLNTALPCPWAPNLADMEATHIKFIHLKYETVRDDHAREAHSTSPTGYLYALFAHVRLESGLWLEIRDWPGIEMNLDALELTTFGAVKFAKDAMCWSEIDRVVLNAANANGILPLGRLVDERDTLI